jgi:hypothetical protein
MIETTIQQTSRTAGEPIAIPADVLTAVDQADQILRSELGRVDVGLIRGTWDRFLDHGPEGWSVILRLQTDIFMSEKVLFANQMRDRVAAKEYVREAVWDFGRAISTQVGELLRQIRADLKRDRLEFATTPA